jgi:6-phosphofructokinase 1
MRIAVLTGGGDVPGLNPAIKALVQRAIRNGYEVLGIRGGWRGLLHYNPDDPSTHEPNVMQLDLNTVRRVDRSGGTFLHTSRTNPSNVSPNTIPDFLREEGKVYKGKQDFTEHVLRVVEHLDIDYLVPIGGDDTLSYGERMHKEGIQTVAIPKTMDNDVYGTDY